jgi:YhcH/YjgK/YiaL family protein
MIKYIINHFSDSLKIKLILFPFLILFFTIFSCKEKKNNNPKDWTENQINNWFDDGTWKGGWDVRADESLDKKELAVQYSYNTKLWEKAFTFLNQNDLGNLQPGNYPIDGENLYAIVSEYVTKDMEDTKFEAHEKYADIQYVIDGEEKIGIVDLSKTEKLIPYDSDKDIGFFTTNEDEYRIATNENYFVFFPHNSHRPSIKVVNNSNVKKIVIKVRIN